MGFLSGKLLIIGLIASLSISQIQTQRFKRETAVTNDLDLSQLGQDLDKIPVIGGALEDLVNIISDALIDTEKISNAVISRIAGGTLPCTVTLNGTFCSGTAENATFALVRAVVNTVPDDVVPQMGKDLAIDVIDAIIGPLAHKLLSDINL